MREQKRSIKLDKLDMQILSRLLNDCRKSDRQIGKEIGISGGAVKARILKMENLGVIENFSLKIEPPALGYGIFYIVITGQEVRDVLNQITLVGEPFLIVPCVGGITVCGIIAKDNVKQKIELAKNLMKEVRVISIFEAENPGINSNLTKTDLKIINELMKNPRERIEIIARKTKFSTKTVTRSIEKLQNDDAIQFTLVYEPTKLEGFIPHAILTWISGDLKIMLEKLEKNFAEDFLQKPFIAKNQIVLFFYSNNIFKMDEITQKIRESPGVEAADLFIPKKIVFPQKWIYDTIKEASKSPTLHLMYQTN